MDIIDKANELAEEQRNEAIRKARSKVANDKSRTHCIICDEPIPEARRQAVAGCKTCIDCQEGLEA